MTSFLDLFKWDRFVATSVIELLFWLLAAIAVLFGVSGLLNGLALVQLAPVNALLMIAFSIISTLAAVVAARVVCEAVIMLFRVNENLMDIRDSLANAAERAPFVVAEVPVVLDPIAAVVEDMLPEPPRPAAAAAPAGRTENRWGEARAPEPRAHEARSHEPRHHEPRAPEPRAVEKSSETSSLEARLAEIRARREATAARIAATTAPSDSTDAGLASARMHLEEAAAPKWVAPPVTAVPAAEARAESAKPAPVEAKAPVVEVKPTVAAPEPAPEVKAPEAKATEPEMADAKVVETKAPEVKAPEVKAPESKRSEGKKSDAKKAAKPAGPAMVKAIEDALDDLKDAAKDETGSPAPGAVAEKPAETDASEGSEKRKTDDAA